MFFNFGRFFGFGFQSKLDNLLKQENLTLETILNEDDILSELKMSSSGKFADFIISHPNEYKKMIHYIIDDVQPQEQDIQQYIKFQFIISEVFSSENEKLINYLFDKPLDNPQEDVQNPLDDQQTESQPTQEQEDKESIRQHLLADFLQVLGNDTLVVTTAGYVNKIIGAIIHRRGHDFWEYLIKNPKVITNLFKHAELKHITEIIEKLIILDTNQEENDDKNYLKERSDLIIRSQKLLSVDSNSNAIISNLCDILIELYKRTLISLETMTSLRTILQNVAQPQYFMNLAIQTQNTVVYNLLNIQFEYYIKIEQIDEGKYAVDLKNLYSSLISHLPQALSQQDLFKVAFQTSKGDQVVPLGDAKLELISFIIQLCQRQEIADSFTKPIIFLNILDLVLKYPSNNQLQIQFDKLVTSIIKSKNTQLQNLLYQDQAILRFLIAHNGSESRKQKPAFQGVLTKITNYLNSNINESEELAKSIDQIKDEWNTYIDELNEVNLKEQQWMCGVNPRMKEQENSSNYNPFVPIPLIPYQSGIRKVESSDDNSITQEKQEFNEVEQEDSQNNDNLNNDNQNQDQEQEQNNVVKFQPIELLFNKEVQINNQELPQIQELQITEDVAQDHDEQKEIKQNELKPEPEPTELIDQQQQPEQHLQQQDQENQQELCEPEPQQQNQIQTQEPQAEPDAQQLVLTSNSQMQDEN
ncbi:unnamed protein product (macronuclear) [Paramecium tetraurelia]|uniref:Serine/threonine-protein phosphatase 4 regulatory subunit 3-like central domain-containing protein n=1 Tax=Paramecium tetraurelia TaxID=5888 RepID=A0E8A4_PARTE|nr:uncharacterized protein GSPATT00024249001 [Paramecium tetraurelia]CAK91521.1 unnamed protein product [Paramecium tetraurelia]|eukprot:XP_001458918.1 hypothetical protein (macronuclear) [Paramecium tetraurelia strain d4-2]